MPNYICTTCGTQYSADDREPALCHICKDERQYINPDGQAWTTLEALRAGHHNRIKEVEPGLTGDTIYVVADTHFVSFMYSYPNLIPLPPADVKTIVAAVEPFAFDRLYAGWFDKMIPKGAKAAVRRSAERYVRMVSEG